MRKDEKKEMKCKFLLIYWWNIAFRVHCIHSLAWLKDWLKLFLLLHKKENNPFHNSYTKSTESSIRIRFCTQMLVVQVNLIFIPIENISATFNLLLYSPSILICLSNEIWTLKYAWEKERGNCSKHGQCLNLYIYPNNFKIWYLFYSNDRFKLTYENLFKEKERKNTSNEDGEEKWGKREKIWRSVLCSLVDNMLSPLAFEVRGRFKFKGEFEEELIRQNKQKNGAKVRQSYQNVIWRKYNK